MLLTGTLDDEDLDALWERWLWNTNLNSPLVEDCGDMNLNQGIGLLICTSLAGSMQGERASIDSLLPYSPLAHLTQGPLLELSQRELLDQLECLQLSWGGIVGAHEELPGACLKVVRCLMARVGILSQRAYPEGSTLDAINYVTQLPTHADGKRWRITSRKFLRKTCCLFVVLLRALRIISRAEPVQECDAREEAAIKESFQEFHVECSVDFYAVLQQMVYLAPGMRLVYRTDFNGMYNDVSQVVYFHYPQYQRQPQLPLEEMVEAPINCLAAVVQLFPDIPVVYDDDDVVPGLTGSGIVIASKSNVPTSASRVGAQVEDILRGGARAAAARMLASAGVPSVSASGESNKPRFAWLVSCATVFLVQSSGREQGPDPPDTQILVSPCESIIPLIAHFLRASGRTLASAAAAGGGNAAAEPVQRTSKRISLAAHAHVDIL